MSDLITTMREWVDERRGKAAPGIELEYHGPTDHAKRGAWVTFRSPDALGQVIVWDSGECEIDIGTYDEQKTLIKSVQVVSSNALIDLLDEAVEFIRY